MGLDDVWRHHVCATDYLHAPVDGSAVRKTLALTAGMPAAAFLRDLKDLKDLKEDPLHIVI